MPPPLDGKQRERGGEIFSGWGIYRLIPHLSIRQSPVLWRRREGVIPNQTLEAAVNALILKEYEMLNQVIL